jgi:hypothetical protein
MNLGANSQALLALTGVGTLAYACTVSQQSTNTSEVRYPATLAHDVKDQWYAVNAELGDLCDVQSHTF